MMEELRKFFRQGAIRIPREKERKIYFYATIALFAAYFLSRLQGIG